jgi:hypothetical protein
MALLKEYARKRNFEKQPNRLLSVLKNPKTGLSSKSTLPAGCITIFAWKWTAS